MKKTSGPLALRLAMNMNSFKTVGKAEQAEKEKLFRLVAEDIAPQTKLLSVDQIFNILMKSDLYFTERLPSSYSGAAGCAIGKRIFVDQSLDYLLNNSDDYQAVREHFEYRNLVHECIHRIQNSYSLTKRDKYIGLVEGATESEALRIENIELGWNDGDIGFNFNGAIYGENVAIIRQLERIYGREVIERLAYQNDKKVVELIRHDYGDMFANGLLNVLKKAASIKNDANPEDVFNVQFKLMTDYFTNKLETITSVEEAESLLTEIKEYMTDLIQFSDMSVYEEFYNKLLDYFKNKFPDFDVDKNKYTEPDLYPLETREIRLYESNNYVRYVLTDYIITRDDMNETKKNFENYHPDDYKEYRLVDGDNIFTIIIFPDNSCHLLGRYGNFDKTRGAIQGYGSYDPETDKYVIKAMTRKDPVSCNFDLTTGELEFDTILEGFKSPYIKLNEEEFDISKEELYYMLVEDFNDPKKSAILGERTDNKVSNRETFNYEEDQKSR